MSTGGGGVRPGDRLGPYEFVRKIAVGGMAEIYLAKVTGISGFEKLVALKMIHPNFAEDDHFVHLLVEEAKIVVHLTQPNIVQIYDLGRIGDVYYIAMEWVDGADLYQVLRTLTEAGFELDMGTSLYIVREVCAGLDYAHRCRDRHGKPLGIIHRDISPQNILLSRAGEVKLADFGIAKASLRARQTAVGVIKGKYYYMSPEQAWGDPVDQRTDIFSAGIVLYECLVGQMLYLEDDLGRLLDRVRKADIAPPSTLRPEIPPELDALVMKALARRPEDRYPTAHHFQVALEQFLWNYDPGYSPARVRHAVDQALRLRSVQRRFDAGGPGSEVPTADAQGALLSREDVIPLSLHSLLSVEDVAGITRQEADGLDFDDETLLSAPPVTGGAAEGGAHGATAAPDGPRSPEVRGWEENEDATTRVAPKRAPPHAGARPMGFPAGGHVGASGGPAPGGAWPGGPARGGVSPGGPAPGVSASSGQGALHPLAAQDVVPAAEVPPDAAPRGRSALPGAAGWGNPPYGLPLGEPLDSDADGLEAKLAARRRWWLWAAGVVAGLLLLGAIVAVLLTARQVLTKPGSVELSSEPEGAVVFYQGKRVGRTPHRLDSLAPDEVHWVRLELPGCESKRVALRVKAGETAHVLVRLENCDEGAALR